MSIDSRVTPVHPQLPPERLNSANATVVDFEDRGSTSEPVHVCNVEITDNHESATIGAFHIVELCALV